MNNNTNVLDVISGKESLKIEVGVSIDSVIYLIGGGLVCGMLLILFSKMLKR